MQKLLSNPEIFFAPLNMAQLTACGSWRNCRNSFITLEYYVVRNDEKVSSKQIPITWIFMSLCGTLNKFVINRSFLTDCKLVIEALARARHTGTYVHDTCTYAYIEYCSHWPSSVCVHTNIHIYYQDSEIDITLIYQLYILSIV